MSNSPPKRILLIVSGSIAAFKAAALCSQLVQRGYEVEVVLSNGGREFIGPASFDGLTRKPVHTNIYEPGSMMAHIDLERWADLILVYPASANMIQSFANGQSEHLAGALFLAHEFKKPFWIAPAMNQAMLGHPATEKNLNQLATWGVTLLFGETGSLACGEIGAGRLVEPENVLRKLELLHTPSHTSKKVLITSGGTSESIDPVRQITNFSTGETGYTIALGLEKQGHSVTFIQSVRSHFQKGLKHVLNYDSTREFSHVLQNELESNHFDYLIHLAAVADYRVERVMDGQGATLPSHSKIQTEGTLLIQLKPNPKVIASVRRWSKNAKLKLISFKLTTGESDLKLSTYDSDYVIHNTLENSRGENHHGTFYERTESGYAEKQHFHSKSELTGHLIAIINSKGAES